MTVTTAKPRRHDSHSVAIIGSGYVGLTLSACLAFQGHRVHCTDRNLDRIVRLSQGDVPIVEEGLTELVLQTLESGHLRFGLDNIAAVAEADYIFLCLPTPEGADGHADLSFVLAVAEEIGPSLRPGACVITKSTVPVGTSVLVEQALGRLDVHVVSNPEFLAEGTAVRDCLEPDRIVVGARTAVIAEAVAALYGPMAIQRSVITDIASAELVKYASNAYLATRLTFVNSIAELCEAVGADVRSVMYGMGSDQRIGRRFLQPGPGWGGSCFPKDTVALVRTAAEHGCDLALVRAAIEANDRHIQRMVDRAIAALDGQVQGSRVAIWGLTFKAGTDDLRQSPAMEIAQALRSLGASVHAYDPTVAPGNLRGIEVHSSSFAACRNADLLLIATEWPEFANVDLTALSPLLNRRAIFDARNMLDPAVVEAHGFSYLGVGVTPTLGAYRDLQDAVA